MKEQYARLAQQFGYEVSPGRAVDTPGGRAYVDRLRLSGARVHRMARWSIVVVVVLVLCIVVVFFARAMLGESAAFVTIVFLGLCVVSASVLARRLKRFEELTLASAATLIAALEEHPWQVWPVRVEAASPEEESVARGALPVDREAAFALKEGHQRVLLLEPDGSVARSYVALVPADVRRGMTDGVGAMWVCGDLRFRVALAAPGARQCWAGSPIPQPARRAADEDSGVIDAIAREAGIFALQEWLG